MDTRLTILKSPAWALPNWFHGSLLAGATGLGALAAWHGNAALLPLAYALPAAWGMARSRTGAYSVALAYYLTASRGIPAGAAVFFGRDTLFGSALWLGTALLLAVPFALLWRRNPGPWRVMMALILVAAPPIGIVGWANPVSAAGVLFPGAGWLGLASAFALAGLLARWPGGFLLIAAFALTGLPKTPAAPDGWAALQTAYPLGGQGGFLADAKRQMALARRVESRGDQVLILPETIAGRWTPASRFLWNEAAALAARRGQTVLLGAAWPAENGAQYHNAVLRLTEGGAVPIYRQLMPVPISMWRPWAGDGARPAWFLPQSADIAGRRAAFLICYEQLLLWPPLIALSQAPDVLVGLSNGWWARGTAIPAIQAAALEAWALLFDTHLIHADNR